MEIFKIHYREWNDGFAAAGIDTFCSSCGSCPCCNSSKLAKIIACGIPPSPGVSVLYVIQLAKIVIISFIYHITYDLHSILNNYLKYDRLAGNIISIDFTHFYRYDETFERCARGIWDRLVEAVQNGGSGQLASDRLLKQNFCFQEETLCYIQGLFITY